jgi:hypothetical protein
LKIQNTIASEVLLFEGAVDKDNYIGTVGSLSSVQIKLPEEKFYTIVAVEKANWEERKGQASWFSQLTYYSNGQTYTVPVSPSSTYGGGNWVFDNFTNYWVQIKKADGSQNYAVIAPNARRVSVPIQHGAIYDYIPYFSKELRYNGKVMALVETNDVRQGNTAQTSAAAPTFPTEIKNVDVSNIIKPAVMVINNSGKTVRVHRAGMLMTNGAPVGDFVVVGGTRQLITGFDLNDNTNTINFRAIAWEDNHRYVPVNQAMAFNKVYEITIPVSEVASAITVNEVDASVYYE